MEMKLLRFEVAGEFAHFNQTLSNRFRNTYSIITKPHILGLLGAIVGFGGYTSNVKIPEYYEKLKDIKIYIAFKTQKDIRFVVNYTSLHSFFNNRVDTVPTAIINEQVLLKPKYELGAIVDINNEVHSKIIQNVQKNRSEFHIYLGKNEFGASLKYIELADFVKNGSKRIKCGSIIPFDEMEKNCDINIKLEKMPIGFDEHFKYSYCLMAIPPSICEIEIRDPGKFIKCGDTAYYVH